MDINRLIPLVIGIHLSACVNLQKVNDFADASIKGLKKYEELEYTFGKACREKCQLEQIRNLRLSADFCNCVNEKTADSVTFVLYNSVKGYFDGLAKLSANNLTTYKLDGLTKTLKSGQFGEVKIDKADVDAYEKISAILLKAFTDGYRKKKIKTYIAAANEPIQVLIKALDFNLAANLTGKLNVHKQRIESIYIDFLNDSSASSFDKKKAILEYNDLIDEADLKQKQIISFSKALKGVGKGHQKLYEHRNKMTAAEVKAILLQQASDLEDIVAEFNKLKNK